MFFFLGVISEPAGYGNCPGRLTWTGPCPVDALRRGASRFVGNGSAFEVASGGLTKHGALAAAWRWGAVKREARPAPKGRNFDAGVPFGGIP